MAHAVTRVSRRLSIIERLDGHLPPHIFAQRRPRPTRRGISGFRSAQGKKIDAMVMVELDSSPDMPVAPKDAARIAKAYLSKQGVTLRS